MALQSGTGLLAVWTDVAPEAEAEFNEWYHSEHIPERLAVPGVLAAQRYQAVEGQPKYIALYELADVKVLESDAYLKLGKNQTPWSEKMLPHFRNAQRGVFQLISSFGNPPAKPAEFVYTARSNVAAKHEAEFNEWHNNEHAPSLARVAGSYRARRYTAVESNPEHLRGFVAMEGNPKYLVVYEIRDAGLPASPEWLRASNTEWKSRMRPYVTDLHKVIGRLIFP
jgi:hypothetical protein